MHQVDHWHHSTQLRQPMAVLRTRRVHTRSRARAGAGAAALTGGSRNGSVKRHVTHASRNITNSKGKPLTGVIRISSLPTSGTFDEHEVAREMDAVLGEQFRVRGGPNPYKFVQHLKLVDSNRSAIIHLKPAALAHNRLMNGRLMLFGGTVKVQVNKPRRNTPRRQPAPREKWSKSYNAPSTDEPYDLLKWEQWAITTSTYSGVPPLGCGGRVTKKAARVQQHLTYMYVMIRARFFSRSMRTTRHDAAMGRRAASNRNPASPISTCASH